MFVYPLTSPIASPALHRALRAAAFPRARCATHEAEAAPRGDVARVPPLDVVESADAYTATLDMPGITKEELSVTVEERRVEISTTRAAESATADGPAATGEARALLRERGAARFARSFVLPAAIDAEAAQARMESGVLTLTLPKRVAKRAASVTVQ